MKCSICGKEIKDGFGNNAWPVNNGTCCNACNANVVIPMRLADMKAMKIVSLLDFEEVEDGINQLRSLESEGIISEEEYDYVLTNWDRLIVAR